MRVNHDRVGIAKCAIGSLDMLLGASSATPFDRLECRVLRAVRFAAPHRRRQPVVSASAVPYAQRPVRGTRELTLLIPIERAGDIAAPRRICMKPELSRFRTQPNNVVQRVYRALLSGPYDSHDGRYVLVLRKALDAVPQRVDPHSEAVVETHRFQCRAAVAKDVARLADAVVGSLGSKYNTAPDSLLGQLHHDRGVALTGRIVRALVNCGE